MAAESPQNDFKFPQPPPRREQSTSELPPELATQSGSVWVRREMFDNLRQEQAELEDLVNAYWNSAILARPSQERAGHLHSKRTQDEDAVLPELESLGYAVHSDLRLAGPRPAGAAESFDCAMAAWNTLAVDLKVAQDFRFKDQAERDAGLRRAVNAVLQGLDAYYQALMALQGECRVQATTRLANIRASLEAVNFMFTLGIEAGIARTQESTRALGDNEREQIPSSGERTQ